VTAKEAVRMMIDHMTSPNNNSRLDVKSGLWIDIVNGSLY